MDADRHAAGIPSAFEYHRRIGGQVDPDVAAAHRWLDSFLPEDAPLQWRRMMGASGDRGKNIATVLQSPLGLGAQAAPNTAVPGSPMPVYSGDRGYRPPPPRAPGAPPPPRPSLFGPLEARRDWAVAKVRELEAIAADPNRSQRDRDSARRGARLITRDIAQYQGMPLTQEELNAVANPLLSRMEAWENQFPTSPSGEQGGGRGYSFEAAPGVGRQDNDGEKAQSTYQPNAGDSTEVLVPVDYATRLPSSFEEALVALQPLAAEARSARNEWRQTALALGDLRRQIHEGRLSEGQNAQMQQQVAQMEAELERLLARRKAVAEKARNLIAIPRSQRGSVQWRHPLVGDIGKLANDAGELTAQYVDASLLPSLSVEIAPEADVKSYQANRRTIKLRPNKTTLSTGMHEVAHAVEHQNKHVLAKTLQFLAGRCRQGEKARRLSKVYPGGKFKSNDWLIEDRWLIHGGDIYTGRFYLDKNGRPNGTEILSMGLERLHADPAAFLDEDPDFFRFIVSTLRYPLP